MKRSLIYIAVFSAMMMVTGCGGGESNSTNDVTTQISEKRDLTYTTDEDGNYYLDFSEMKSDAKAIIQTSGNGDIKNVIYVTLSAIYAFLLIIVGV